MLDWKRQVFELYARVRANSRPQHAWQEWRTVRARLFRDHRQSPRRGFSGLLYFDYEPAARVLAEVSPAEPQTLEITGSAGSSTLFRRFARARFELYEQACSLDLYWLEGYGGGIFLPFADQSSGRETYGGGRYLLDTVKGADLGTLDGRLVLDFNFAYNPSCAYDGRWACPLAPPANRLSSAVHAGERAPLAP
ncbi:MAG: DUF1684 domain-containing protein [Chloroflexi bacterium]|nr:DUF1684 domain-containing protein [Chloroflexota bacterium]